MSEVDPTLARAVLHERALVLFDHYEELAERLTNPLARAAMDTMVHEETERGTNAALVANFVGELPHAQLDVPPGFKRQVIDRPLDGWVFRTADPAKARQIQDSVLWIESEWGPTAKRARKYPSYIVGSRPSTRHKGCTDVLLQAAFEGGAPSTKLHHGRTALMQLLTSTAGLKAARVATSTSLDREFSHEELERLLDSTTGDLQVGPQSPGSVQTHPGLYTHADWLARRKDFTRGGALRTKSDAFTKDRKLRATPAYDTRPLNPGLESYDTLCHLADLAIKFQRVSELDLLFALRLQQDGPSPIDRLLEE